jgi:subtilisin family serine protease
VIAGIDWMIANHQAGVPAVANMSLGGGFSAALNAQVAAATADGITMVVAAGNSGADACGASPASEPAAITVGATDSSDTRASFSNYGSCVDVFAPGVAVLSSWLDSTTATASLSGTSMASPHVAGVAAVLLSEGYTNANVTNAITSSATPGIVNDAAGSPNLLVSLANPVGNVTPVTPPATTPAPAPAPAPAPGTTPAPTASLSHLHVSFRALRGRANRGTYIISGSASDAGTLRITLTGRTGVLSAKGKRISTRAILNYTVDSGPFAISTPVTAKGATVQIFYTPADASIAPIVSNPVVQRTVAGTQTHLPAKSAVRR